MPATPAGARFRKPLISGQGLYKLVVHHKDEGIGAVIQSQGAYDLGQFQALDKTYHLLRVPLHSTEHLHTIVCKHSRKRPGFYKVRSVSLMVHHAACLCSPRLCARSSRTTQSAGWWSLPMQPSPLCTQFQDDTERRMVEPTNTVSGFSGASAATHDGQAGRVSSGGSRGQPSGLPGWLG